MLKFKNADKPSYLTLQLKCLRYGETFLFPVKGLPSEHPTIFMKVNPQSLIIPDGDCAYIDLAFGKLHIGSSEVEVYPCTGELHYSLRKEPS